MTDLVAPSGRLVDAATGLHLTGVALTAAVGRARRAYDNVPEGAIFARTAISLPSVLRYVAALEVERAVALLDPALAPETLDELIRRYQPAAVVGLDEGDPVAEEAPKGYVAVQDDGLGGRGGLWRREGPPEQLPHPDLAVLLATSGSTGNPKLVRLSRGAVHANAVAIAQALEIDDREIAPTSLPLFYTYGLSVLNSHLVAGATVVVADGGVLSRDFWRACEDHRATSLAGVPYNYEMLARIRWKPHSQPHLRTLTQAGGKMRVELVAQLHEQISATGGRLFVMYGQTEATARISILPASRLPEKLGSAGPAVPGGRLSIRLEDGTRNQEPGVDGEIIYEGPNVMLGYADDMADLARGDDMGGVLPTGDLGHLDDDGFLYLTGRVKRIGKVFGVRINLDDVERIAAATAGPVAAIAAGDRVVVWYPGATHESCRALAGRLAVELHLHRSGFDVRSIDHLPTLSSGKVDYRDLAAEVDS